MVFEKGKIPDAFPPEGFGSSKARRPGGGPRQPILQIKPMTGLLGLLIGVFVLAGIAMAVTGKLGLVNIDPAQVAVKVNYLTGKKEPILRPGYTFYLPFVQEVFILDKRPQNFVMSGTEFRNRNQVPLLTVRANDGSNFRFESIEIQYSIMGAEAARVLEDSGPGDNFKREWVKAYARSILRDEFGRYSAEEIANPVVLQTAFSDAENRLRDSLEPYGITVLEMPQQKPNFDAEYERAINDRKTTDQDVERLIATEDQLKRERAQRLAGVEREKSIEMEQLRGELDRERLEAERDKTQKVKAADAFKIERESEGDSEQASLVAQADGLTEKYTKEAEGVQAQAEALESRGEVVVREALIEKLLGIRFTFVPYSRDPAPNRIEYEDTANSGVSNRLETGGSQ